MQQNGLILRICQLLKDFSGFNMSNMQKTIKKLVAWTLLTIILGSFFNLTSFASGFSDVTANTTNKEAILYLQDKGIIKGYEDGTFKPSKSVSRAEFLKIIIEGSKLELDNDSEAKIPFTDIEQAAWYEPYIKTAYSSGWINGYEDGTFKPDKTISKVEALKVLAKAQNWKVEKINTSTLKNSFKDIVTTAWYTPYLAYAKQNKYLNEKGPKFSPNGAMTRGNISGIIYRTIMTDTVADTTPTSTPSPAKSTTTPPPPPPGKAEIQPEVSLISEPETNIPGINSSDFGLIKQDSFEKIKLTEDLPNIFYKNEIFVISGTITSGTYEKATVILANKNTDKNTYFTANTNNNNFDIPIHFKTPGDYNIGLVPGESGQSHAYKLHVNSDLPSSTTVSNFAPQSSQIKYINNNEEDSVTATFSNIAQTMKMLTLSQNNKTVSYFSRQDTDSIPINYSDFANFSSGTVTYNLDIAKLNSSKPLEISSSFVKGISSSFNAVEHSYDETNEKEVSASMPGKIDFGKTIEFTGTAKTDLKLSALVLKPDGKVEEMDLSTDGQPYTYFNQKIIPKDSHFTFTYSPKTTGRYIIEINNKNSEPSINHPVYVGDIYPLIPDFFDLNERKLFKGQFDLTSERNKLLDLINKSRTEAGLKTIVLDDTINTLAQNHSDDMKANNYFSHYNLSNQTPDDRRLKLAITTPVGENIAVDVSSEFAHYGLMRSAGHRENILTKDWTRVGLGITLDNDELIFAEEFSTNPLTTNDLDNFKSQLFQDINQKRQEKSLTVFTELSNLVNAAKQLNENSINGQAIDNQSFAKALSDNNFSGGAKLMGSIGGNLTDNHDEFINDEPDLWESIWQKIGINIQIDKNGKIYTIVILGGTN